MIICNALTTFWRNFRHFLILCTFIIITLQLSLVRCGTSYKVRRNNIKKRISLGGYSYLSRIKSSSSMISITEENSEIDGCNVLCVAIIIGIVVLITLILCICLIRRNKRRRKKKQKYGASTRSYLPSFMERSTQIQPSLRPPILDATSNDEAERYSTKNPPQEKLPPPNFVKIIQDLGGAKAWEWEPVEDLLAQQNVSIEKETNIVTFHKRKIVSVQTNYPFFIPQVEGDKLYEAPFETPETMPHRQGQMLHYFEITILENPEGQNTYIAIGLATKPYPPFRLPGWNIHSVSFQSADGLKYNDSIKGEKFSQPWSEGDTIGCGYNPDVGHVFFTKNGQLLGNAFKGMHHIWYPTIGATGPCTLETNFGDDFDNEYLYDNAKGYGPGGPLLRSSTRRLRPVRRSTGDNK
ncbi:hypothetical protein Glove_22g158 [Diversispora epigaea]|uniref:B30.2/SPRY domain-containing protein n=1 Tax=Diversispora epigaea TaxID=1348612 RepID=A0A397JKF0_9GLOM|nr:hypothetical protein Glove_22g158 [Diversispora epigaea]